MTLRTLFLSTVPLPLDGIGNATTTRKSKSLPSPRDTYTPFNRR